jgi:hypothetical protein
MPLHDWTRVEDSTFHDFHSAWIIHLKEALNGGALPPGYYAMAEQHVGRRIADVLALHASDPEVAPSPPEPAADRTVAVAEAPPRTRETFVLTPTPKGKRRTLTIRHTTGHRIIALVEVLAPSNKSSAHDVGEFVGKVVSALRSGIHVVCLDLLPPGAHDPDGIDGAVADVFAAEPGARPEDRPLTFVSYAAASPPKAYLDRLAVGDELPPTPLFLSVKRYVELPLAPTYDAASRGMPAFWREVIEGRRSLNGQ